MRFASIALICIAIAGCASNGGTTTNPNKQPSATDTAAAPHWVVQKSQRNYPDGFPSSSQIFEYDKSGRIAVESEFNSSDVLVIIRKYQYKPDHGVEILTLDADNALQAKSIQEYKNGLLIRERLLSSNDEVHFTSDFRYNDRGHKVYWGISGKSAATTVSEYQYEGDHLVKITVTGPSQAPIKHYSRIYSKTGQLERENEFDGKDVLLNQTYYSWTAGRLERETIKTAKGVEQSSIVYHYDPAGHPVKLEIYGLAGELQEIQTQDWIELKTSGNGK